MIIFDIVNQHFEEAAFLWFLRNTATVHPYYNLRDLTELDDRVEAHLDGLRLAQTDSWEICKDTLITKEPEEFFVAAVLAFESEVVDRVETVMKACSDDTSLSMVLVSALDWLEWKQVEKHAHYFSGFRSTKLQAVALAVSACHQQDPGKILVESLSSGDQFLKSKAIKAVGMLGRVELLHLLEKNLYAVDEECCFYASWSTTLLGGRGAISVLRSIAENDTQYSETACTMALRRMDIEEGYAWLKDLAHKESHIRIAILGAGVVGDPISIPWLIEVMDILELARVAGESFTMITGVDLVNENLETDWPEGFEAGPTEDPEDDDVEMDADEDLPWPNQELIAKWWNENKGNFRTGIRYLVGKPIAEEHLQHVLRTGYQRQRAAAAIELSMLKPGTPLFNVRAPGFRQMKMLGLK